jgi:hypothetical protein
MQITTQETFELMQYLLKLTKSVNDTALLLEYPFSQLQRKAIVDLKLTVPEINELKAQNYNIESASQIEAAQILLYPGRVAGFGAKYNFASVMQQVTQNLNEYEIAAIKELAVSFGELALLKEMKLDTCERFAAAVKYKKHKQYTLRNIAAMMKATSQA